MEQESPVVRRRHSAQLKALVVAQCAAPGASVAKVAMAHKLNANMVHGWRKLVDQGGGLVRPPGRLTLSAKAAPHAPQFMPVSMAQSTLVPAPADIQIELRRGATAVKISWPSAASADCAAWMRELLR